MTPVTATTQPNLANCASVVSGINTNPVPAIHAIAQTGINHVVLRKSRSKTQAHTRASKPPAAAVMPYMP